MFSKTLPRLFTVSIATSVLLMSACKKDDDNNPHTQPILPNSNPIVFQTPTGDGFYIGEDYHFTNNPFAETDYLVTCPIYINDGHTIIEPGTKIKFQGHETGIYVIGNGGLTVYGQPGAPVILDGVEQYPGSWKGVFFGTDNPNNKLEHCIIKYAGSSVAEFMDERASVGITNQHEETQENAAWITDTYIYGSGGYGIYVSSLKGKFYQFGKNMIANSNLSPLGIPFKLAPMITSDCNLNPDTAQNTLKYVFLYNDGFNQSIDINQDASLINPGIAYRIRGTEGVTLIGANLTLAPGTVFEFDYEGGFCVRSGSLKAIGTASEPIIFKGIAGGEGKWVGLSFHSNSPDNQLVNCIVTGGGSKKSPVSDGKANIVLGSYLGDLGTLTVTNCEISHSGGWPIAKKQTSSLTQNGNTFVENVSSPDVYIYP